MKPELDQASSQNFSLGAVLGPSFAGANLYRENTFRAAELGVEATDRDFKRRLESIEANEEIKVVPTPGPGRALPLKPPADSVRLREMFQQLGGDPEQRLVEEFFWFWPHTPGCARTDEALLALVRDDVATAERLWREREQQPALRMVADHNLAVLAHFRAIEFEFAAEADSSSQRQRGAAWIEAFKRWKRLHDSEAVWSRVRERITQSNDSRLKTGAARRLETWLPRGLLTINAQLAVRHAAAGRANQASWHIALMRDVEIPVGIVAEVLNAEAAPAREQVRNLCRSVADKAKQAPEWTLSAVQGLLEQTRGSLLVLDLLLGDADPSRKGARDEVAEQMRSSLIGYTNRTEDWAGAEPLLQAALKLAVTAQTRERIEKDIGFVRASAKETNWWHGPGYYDLAPEIGAELERGYALAESGSNAEAVAVVAALVSGSGGVALPPSGRPVAERALAYALNRKAVRAGNAALAVYNENPPRLARLGARVKAGELRPSNNCCICGGGLYGTYYRRQMLGSNWFFCESCNGPINAELEAQKAEFRRMLPEPLLEAMLAAELNPKSAQLAENLRINRAHAVEFGVPVPASTLSLRLQLGVATEDELCYASLSWFSSGRAAARRALLAQFPARYKAFRKTHRFRQVAAWGLGIAALVALVGWSHWTSRPATLALSVVGAPTYELGIDGRTISITALSLLPKFPPGRREISVKAAGFRLAKSVVDLPPGGEGSWRVELEPEHGSIEPTVTIDRKPAPPGFAATVTWMIDGKVVPLVEGRLANIPAGTRVLKATHPEYESAEGVVKLDDGQILKPNAELAPKPAELRLLVEGTSNYSVTIDGEDRVASSGGYPISPGRTHRIVVSADGFRRAIRSLSLVSKASETWRVDLVPMQGDIEPTVTINRKPAPAGFAATVTWMIDGKETPLREGRLVRIPVGDRVLKASHPDYELAEGSLRLVDGQTLKPRVELTPKPATLRLTAISSPSYTMIIDGMEKMPSDVGYSLSPGVSHKVVVHAPGFVSVERTLTLNPNATEIWEVQLKEIPRPKEGEEWRVPEVELTMLWIGRGQFAMGSPKGGEKDERPVTNVRLTRGYWLGQTEVTQAQWRTVMGSDPSKFRGDSRPVENVSWSDAMEFCRRLTTRERQAGRLPANLVYTLPTEAQWEYACRAGTTGDYAGDLEAMAWYDRNSGHTTHPVAQKRASVWGLHDMHGNVWEWCLDWHADKLPGGSVVDPSGPPSGSYRVNRGGSWGRPATDARSAHRTGDSPDLRFFNLGFRLALSSVP